MINVLNNPNLTVNFKLEEFICKCGCGTVMLDYEGIHLLQLIREHYGVPVVIVSPFRCKKHNDEVGGAPQSKHMLGIAYDIRVMGVHPQEVAKFAFSIGYRGIGVYTNNGNYFTHVDARKTQSLWRDQKGTHELVKVTNTNLWR
jgi:hypothetical protein